MKGSANPGGLAEGCLGGIRGLVFVPNLGLVAWSGPELEILLNLPNQSEGMDNQASTTMCGVPSSSLTNVRSVPI